MIFIEVENGYADHHGGSRSEICDVEKAANEVGEHSFCTSSAREARAGVVAAGF
jgi:hypothetical protein